MGRKPSYYLHDNTFRMPQGFPPEGFESGSRYQAEAGDIFLVTYPKCGTTWTQYLIWLLDRQGQPLSANEKLDRFFPHLEEVGGEAIERLPKPRLIKTHLPYALTPQHPQAKYIYVARNPFDCAVSFYHHTRGFIKHYDFAEGTFEDFFECFLAGEVDFGDYFDHLLSWYAQKSQENFLFLTYEQMQADIKENAIKIAEFLGGNFLDSADNSTILERAIAQSHFSKMQEHQQRWASKRPENMPPFIRQGKVGDWKNYFSADREKRLRDKFRQRTGGTDLGELWSRIV